jgi:hypothetical protein
MFSFSYFLKKKLPVDLSTREVFLFLGTPILMFDVPNQYINIGVPKNKKTSLVERSTGNFFFKK